MHTIKSILKGYNETVQSNIQAKYGIIIINWINWSLFESKLDQLFIFFSNILCKNVVVQIKAKSLLKLSFSPIV